MASGRDERDKADEKSCCSKLFFVEHVVVVSTSITNKQKRRTLSSLTTQTIHHLVFFRFRSMAKSYSDCSRTNCSWCFDLAIRSVSYA